MCERAVLLFNEYINISKNYGNDKTNLLDVKQFIINKTIGPLKLSIKDKNIELDGVNKLGEIYLKLIYTIFGKVIEISNFYYEYDEFFESISCILSNIMYKIYALGKKDYITEQLNILGKNDIHDIPREVNLLKIKLELFHYIYSKTDNELTATDISETIVTDYTYIIDELEDINEFFDCQTKIQDKNFYKKLISKIDSII